MTLRAVAWTGTQSSVEVASAIADGVQHRCAITSTAGLREGLRKLPGGSERDRDNTKINQRPDGLYVGRGITVSY